MVLLVLALSMRSFSMYAGLSFRMVSVSLTRVVSSLGSGISRKVVVVISKVVVMCR